MAATLNLNELSQCDTLEEKAKIFLLGIEERTQQSLDFIRTKYAQYEKLDIAMIFSGFDLLDTLKAGSTELLRGGFYPSTEAGMELDQALKHALIGSYKAAYADLRRSLEMVLFSVYLTSKHKDHKWAFEWMESKEDTPYFSRILKDLAKEDKYKELDAGFEWVTHVKQLYWKLSDFAHNKGKLNGYRELNKINMHIGFTYATNINLDTLIDFCDYFLETLGEITTILALYNPILLVGVPIDEKFGFNPPMSGYFYDVQAERLNALIPAKYRSFFDDMIANDKEIIGILEWFNDQPDLTEEDFKKQAEEQDRMMNNFSNKEEQ